VGIAAAEVDVGAEHAVAVPVRADAAARKAWTALVAVKGMVDSAGPKRAGRAARWVSAVAAEMCNWEHVGLAERMLVQSWRLRNRNLRFPRPRRSMAVLEAGMWTAAAEGIVGRRPGAASAVRTDFDR
jgi:hypothetical protein